MKSPAIGDIYSGVFFRHGVMYQYELAEIKKIKRPKEEKNEEE